MSLHALAGGDRTAHGVGELRKETAQYFGEITLWKCDEMRSMRRRFPPKLLTRANEAELEFQAGRAYRAVK
jgi:hypothetical protein